MFVDDGVDKIEIFKLNHFTSDATLWVRNQCSFMCITNCIKTTRITLQMTVKMYRRLQINIQMAPLLLMGFKLMKDQLLCKKVLLYILQILVSFQ